MNKFLTDNQFAEIAKSFNLNIAHIKAIFKVEAGGRSGFLKDNLNLPVTLQEGHVFYKYAKRKGLDVETICKEHPNICYPKWTKCFYKKGISEYNRYLSAKSIDEECAMLSTSWGIGQIMGFNYRLCGYDSLQSFVEKMHNSEYYQLQAMCNFIANNKNMYDALCKEDWAKFAKLYNGPGYTQNKYDKKLEKAYKQYFIQ